MSDLSKLPGIEDCLYKVFSYCTVEDLLTCHQLSSSWRETLESHSLKKCWMSRLKKLVEDNEIVLKASGYHITDTNLRSRGDWNKICHKFIKEGNVEDIIQFSKMLVASLKRIERPMNREGPIEWMDPLHIAVLESDSASVKFILPLIKVYGKYQGKTPFVLACAQKEIAIIKLFLEIIEEEQLGNIFKDVDHEGKSGFMWLCHHGLNDLIQDIKFPNSTVMTLENFSWFDTLISVDDPRDRDGSTPLMTATMKKHYSTVKLLIRRGANVNAKDKSGKTAFTLAIWLADIPMLKLYFQYAKEKNIDFNSTDKTGRTAYVYACMLKLEEVVNILKEKAEEFGIDLLTKDIDGLMGSDFIEIRESHDEFDFVLELGKAEEWNRLTKNERRLRFYNRKLRDKPESSFIDSHRDDYRIDEDHPVYLELAPRRGVHVLPSNVETAKERYRKIAQEYLQQGSDLGSFQMEEEWWRIRITLTSDL